MRKTIFIMMIVCTLFSCTAISENVLPTESREYWNSLPTIQPEDDATKWTRIGAIGSCVGAFLSFMAVVIALCAYSLPLRIKLKAELGSAYGVTGSSEIEFYTITIRNCGLRPVTIDDVMIRVGKHNKYIILWKAGEFSILHSESAQTPKRLETGEAMTLYLYRNRLDLTVKKSARENKNERLYIVADEAVEGKKYFRTKAWTRDFLLS